MGAQRYFGNRAHGVIHIAETATVADVADGEIITIGTKIYEFDVAGDGVSGSNVLVLATGSPTAQELRATLLAAINANKPNIPVSAVVGFAEPALTGIIVVEADAEGIAGNMVFTTTMATGTSSISGTGLLEYGENGSSQKESRGEWIVSAEDALAVGIQIDTGLSSPRFAQIDVMTTAGVFKAWDGALTIVGRELRFDNSGSVDWIEGDKLVWQCWE